jgi:hypothetical protein
MAAPENVRRKTATMIREGYRPDVAYAAAHDMRRRHRLTKGGGYRRVHRRKRGPRGAQRRL